MAQYPCFTFSKALILLLGVFLFWPGLAYAGGRKDTPKGNYGSGADVFVSSPVTFTLSDGSTFTLESSVRCETVAPGDCLSANAIFPYFYVVTIGSTAVSQKFTLKINAPFDTHNSPVLNWGIIDGPDAGGIGTVIAACSTSTCIDGVLAASSSYQNGILTFNLDPTTLTTGQFASGDQIFLYATSFSPPSCSFDLSTGLSCSQSTSLTGTVSLSASGGSISPSNTPGLVPVLPTPRKIVAPAESTYFNPSPQFTGNAINVQASQGSTNTLLSGFVSSFVDALTCSFCGANAANVVYGYIYNVQIPSTVSVSSLPGTITLTLSAPYNQDGFEFLSFGVLGTDGNFSSSVVNKCPTDPNAYNTCLNAIVTDAKVQPTSLTFTISTANLSPGDNLMLFATSNNKPNSCNTTTDVCVSSTPILPQGDATTALSFTTGSPTTVTGPSDPLPVPAISSLAPNSILQGSSAFTLTVNGAPIPPATDAFVAGAQVQWNGSARTTTFVSPIQLTAQIPTTDLVNPGKVSVTVQNPSNPSTTTTPNGGPSAPVNFTVVAPNPVPTLTLLNPASAAAGGPGFTLTVTGTGFVTTSQVKFNGRAETTSFVSSTQVTASIPAGDIATAATVNVTVTNPPPGGGTSGGLTFRITGAKPPTVVSLSPNSGTGVTKTFTMVYSDPNGVSDLKQTRLLFNTSATFSAACFVSYSPGPNQLFLYNNAGTGLSSAVTPGSSAQVSNSQCTLKGTGSSFSKSGNSLTLRVALTFTGKFAGLKKVYLYAWGNDGLNSSWVQKGTWTVPAPPSIVSLSPNSGTGVTKTFTMVYSDPNGVSDLKQTRLLFNTSATFSAACFVTYSPGTNQLFLYNDAGTGASAAVTPGSSAQVSNSQCTLKGTGSSFSKSGNNLTLSVALTFTGKFSGQKKVYLYAWGNDGLNSNWVQKGTWTP
jgi:hypothetical protein